MEYNYESQRTSPLRMVASATNLKTVNDSVSGSPMVRNISLRTRQMMPLKSSPLRTEDTDYALAMCRESRRVSPGRLPTESELCNS